MFRALSVGAATLAIAISGLVPANATSVASSASSDGKIGPFTTLSECTAAQEKDSQKSSPCFPIQEEGNAHWVYTHGEVSDSDVKQVIEYARTTDPSGFEYRLNALSSSHAMSQVAAWSNNPQQVLSMFAAISTDEQVARVIESTQGKRFVVKSDGSAALVDSLKPGEVEANGLNCPAAYAAASAWYIASGMMCGGLGALTAGTAGWACEFAFSLASPSFNDAC